MKTDYPEKMTIGECGVYLWARGHQKEISSVPILKQDQTTSVLPVGAAPVNFTTWIGRTERYTLLAVSAKEG